MSATIEAIDARRLLNQLMNSPIAPGKYSYFINAGTDHILDSLDENYFRNQLADGLGCFKYLEGDYGSGKTQFINSLARRASERNVVTSIVNIGANCPFNSPPSIFRSIMESFQTSFDARKNLDDEKGIEVLIQSWIEEQILQFGVEQGNSVPESVETKIENQISRFWPGAPDTQMAFALIELSRRLLKISCGAVPNHDHNELTSWIRGHNVRSRKLRELGLFQPAADENAFQRLKTAISFLRTRMTYKGFFIAFDEGTRLSSFKKGAIKQRQAIENMLTMINQNAEGEFGGVMFLYAATPDFRSDVISSYRALQDRIGNDVWRPASPMVPLINIEDTNSREMISDIGKKLLSVFSVAHGKSWDEAIQIKNMNTIIDAQRDFFFEIPRPRIFVYQYCRFLTRQLDMEDQISPAEANNFVNDQPLFEEEDM